MTRGATSSGEVYGINSCNKTCNELKVWSSQLCLRFKQSQLSPKNVFAASTGFKIMASALALQCTTSVSSLQKIHMFHSFHGVRWIQQIGLLPTLLLVFLAQLVQHCSANAEAMGSNPVEAPKTFFGLNCDCLNRKHNCDDHTFSSFVCPQFTYYSYKTCNDTSTSSHFHFLKTLICHSRITLLLCGNLSH